MHYGRVKVGDRVPILYGVEADLVRCSVDQTALAAAAIHTEKP